jgi:chromosome segregation ATPase
VFLSARLLEDAGDIDNALRDYKAAQKAYTEYNFMAAAKEIDVPIGRLQRLKRQGDQLIPLQTLVDRRNLIEKDIVDLNNRYQEKHNQLEATDAQVNLKETELLSLSSQIKELSDSLEITQKDRLVLQKLKEETKELENRKESSQAWLEQIDQEKSSLVEQVINLREQAQALDIRVAQTALKLNDRLAALQAQIDLKNSELEKNSVIIIQRSTTVKELENLIEQRRHELALPKNKYITMRPI